MVLISDFASLRSAEADALWERLVEKGFAERIVGASDEDNGVYNYQFKEDVLASAKFSQLLKFFNHHIKADGAIPEN